MNKYTILTCLVLLCAAKNTSTSPAQEESDLEFFSDLNDIKEFSYYVNFDEDSFSDEGDFVVDFDEEDEDEDWIDELSDIEQETQEDKAVSESYEL